MGRALHPNEAEAVMGLPKRCRSFVFEPQAFLNDPAVLRMNATERGAYSTLLFSLWDMPEPGVVEDNDSVLSTLSRTNGEWKDCREAVSRAFDTETRPGWWVQKRMVRTFSVQNRQIKALIEAGRRGGKTKARNNKASQARATLKPPSSHPLGYKPVPVPEPLSRTPFVVPTLDETKSYIQEQGLRVDAEQWWNFYSAKGWMIGKNKMVSWKSALATWNRNERVNSEKPSKSRMIREFAKQVREEEKSGQV